MKQKGQAKQNTKKELKETLNWTNTAETVAPNELVTLHRSNRWASDTPVPYHRCIGLCRDEPSGEVQVEPVEPEIPS